MLCFQEMVGAVDLPQHASLLCYLLKFTFVIQQVLIMLISALLCIISSFFIAMTS